jgi:hypothetical protein
MRDVPQTSYSFKRIFRTSVVLKRYTAIILTSDHKHIASFFVLIIGCMVALATSRAGAAWIGNSKVRTLCNRKSSCDLHQAWNKWLSYRYLALLCQISLQSGHPCPFYNNPTTSLSLRIFAWPCFTLHLVFLVAAQPVRLSIRSSSLMAQTTQPGARKCFCEPKDMEHFLRGLFCSKILKNWIEKLCKNFCEWSSSLQSES